MSEDSSIKEAIPFYADISECGEYLRASHVIEPEAGRSFHLTARRHPAKPGWYNAATSVNRRCFRYWTGRSWSKPVDPTRDMYNPEAWEAAKEGRSRNSRVLYWRNVKPYLPGDEWEFLRE